MSKIEIGINVVNGFVKNLSHSLSASEIDDIVIDILKRGGFIDSVITGPDEESIYVKSENKMYRIYSTSFRVNMVYSIELYSILKSKIDELKRIEKEIIDIANDQGDAVTIDIFNEELTYTPWNSSSDCWYSSSDC